MLEEYLKYLLFNDNEFCFNNGMNQNAMDRRCVLDNFKEDIKLILNLTKKFEYAKSRYNQYKLCLAQKDLEYYNQMESQLTECAKVYLKDFLMTNKLKFGELKKGDYFISFPQDGDNNGHGGYLGSYNVFTKIDPCFSKSAFDIDNDWPRTQPNLWENSVGIQSGNLSHMPDNMDVVKLS